MTWLPPDPPARLLRRDASAESWSRWLALSGWTAAEAARLAVVVVAEAQRLPASSERPAVRAAVVAVLVSRPPVAVAALPRGPAVTLSPDQLGARLRVLEVLPAGASRCVDVITGERWVVEDPGEDRAALVAVLASAVFRLLRLGVVPLRRVTWATGTATAAPELRAWFAPTEAALQAAREEGPADRLLDFSGGYLARRYEPLEGEPVVLRVRLTAALGYDGPGTAPRQLRTEPGFRTPTSDREREVLRAVAGLRPGDLAAAARLAGLPEDDDLLVVIAARVAAARAMLPDPR